MVMIAIRSDVSGKKEGGKNRPSARKPSEMVYL
jgi:hypothetical protein